MQEGGRAEGLRPCATNTDELSAHSNQQRNSSDAPATTLINPQCQHVDPEHPEEQEKQREAADRPRQRGEVSPASTQEQEPQGDSETGGKHLRRELQRSLEPGEPLDSSPRTKDWGEEYRGRRECNAVQHQTARDPQKNMTAQLHKVRSQRDSFNTDVSPTNEETSPAANTREPTSSQVNINNVPNAGATALSTLPDVPSGGHKVTNGEIANKVTPSAEDRQPADNQVPDRLHRNEDKKRTRESTLPTPALEMLETLRKSAQLEGLALLYGVDLAALQITEKGAQGPHEKQTATNELATLKAIQAYLADR